MSHLAQEPGLGVPVVPVCYLLILLTHLIRMWLRSTLGAASISTLTSPPV